MKFSVITAFEEMFESPMRLGLVGQAIERKDIELQFINPRKFTSDLHQSIDDRPFGGGDGMLMSADPLSLAIAEAQASTPTSYRIFLSPQGKPLTQSLVKELALKEHLVLLCGRYAGVDERLLVNHIDLEISLGDFILSGAELAAMCLIDAISRLQDGVLGNVESHQKDSFEEDLLEWPQFTRPREWADMKVPEVLLSGDHKKIESWKYLMRLLKTAHKRPDLLGISRITAKDRLAAIELFKSMSAEERKICGLGSASHGL